MAPISQCLYSHRLTRFKRSETSLCTQTNIATTLSNWKSSNICLRKTTKIQCAWTSISPLVTVMDKWMWRMNGLTHSVSRELWLTLRSMMLSAQNTILEWLWQGKHASWALRAMASSRHARICRWLLGCSRTSRTMSHSSSQVRQALISHVRLCPVSVISCWPRPNTCSIRWHLTKKWRRSFCQRLLSKFQAISLRHMRLVRPTSR